MAQVLHKVPVGVEDVVKTQAGEVVYEGPLEEAIKKYEDLRQMSGDGHALALIADNGSLMFACS